MTNVSRRGLLIGGGALAGAATVGLPIFGSGAALAAIPSGGYARVDVTQAAQPYALKVRGNPTYDTFAQCVFLEQNTGNLFVKQQQASNTTDGNLVVTRRTPNSSGGWDFADRMLLNGFGHGGSFSVNYSSSTGKFFLWIEADANPSSGFGRAVAHFEYKAATTYTTSNVSPLYPFGPNGSYGVTCCARYDDTNALVVRYHSGDNVIKYQAWDVDRANANDFSAPLLSTPVLEPNHGSLFNGWTFKGQYVYFVTGHSRTDDLVLHSFNLNSPSSWIKEKKTALASISPREPEGVMVDSRGGKIKVAFGMTNSYSGEGKYVDMYAVTT